MALKTLKPRIASAQHGLSQAINSSSWRATKETSAQRGYGSKWQKARLAYLRAHPLCVFCHSRGIVTVATVVDHITPHRGDFTKFWNSKNWQSLCKKCHDSEKAKHERAQGGMG